MPFYRINGMTVHIKGTKRACPPPCAEAVGLRTSDGQAMQICGAPPNYQCDWPMPEGTSPGRGHRKTCDRHLCAAHANQVGRNKHYCPEHHLQHLDSQAQPGLFTQLISNE